MQTKSAYLASEPIKTWLSVKEKGWILTLEALWLSKVWERTFKHKFQNKYTNAQSNSTNAQYKFYTETIAAFQEGKGIVF